MTTDDERREKIRQLLLDLLVELIPYMTVGTLHGIVRLIMKRAELL